MGKKSQSYIIHVTIDQKKKTKTNVTYVYIIYIEIQTFLELLSEIGECNSLMFFLQKIEPITMHKYILMKTTIKCNRANKSVVVIISNRLIYVVANEKKKIIVSTTMLMLLLLLFFLFHR